jgi:hypothetical protein
MREPTGQYSITTPQDIADTTDTRRIERDHLNELIADAEAAHGPLKAEEIQTLHDRQPTRDHLSARPGRSRPPAHQLPPRNDPMFSAMALIAPAQSRILTRVSPP